MTKGKAKVERFAGCDMRPLHRDIETENISLPTRCPVTEAYVWILNRKVPNDRQGRTFARLIAEAMILRALKGDVRAIKEITDRVEGRVLSRA